MNFTGLSLDQAPPLQAPVRFFITAPLFGMIAAVMIFMSDPASLMSRYSMESIVITHLFTIGIFAMVMLGALQQMLPVLAGVSLPKAAEVSTFSHAALSVGLLCMAVGLLSSNQILGTVAAIGLGLGFLSLLGAIAYALKKVAFFTPTVRAMAVAVAVAFVIVFLGLHLLSAHLFGNISAHQMTLSDIHSVWAIFGFAGVLIIGVAYQVLPMFYVTSAFKRSFTAFVVPLIGAGLVVWGSMNIYSPSYAWTGKFVIMLFFLTFAGAIWKKMKHRRRPVSDVTSWYWYLGALMLGLGLLLWLANELLMRDYTTLVAILIGGGFLLSVMMGMLYKIVPFLVWFHLNASGYMTIPTMREMINEKMAKFQFALFVMTLLLFMAAFWVPSFMKIGAITLLFSMILLEINLMLPLLTYRRIKKSPPDFVMTPVV